MTGQRVNGTGRSINTCEVPVPAPRSEAQIWTSIRDRMIATHCDHSRKASAEHSCAGRITITAKHITLQCALCGDRRAAL